MVVVRAVAVVVVVTVAVELAAVAEVAMQWWKRQQLSSLSSPTGLSDFFLNGKSRLLWYEYNVMKNTVTIFSFIRNGSMREPPDLS